MERLFAKLGESVVVKLKLLSLLKLVVILMMVVLGWGIPAIAATSTPDDLQSFVIQAADNLDLPLFPLTDSGPKQQANAEDLDSPTPNVYSTPPKITSQSSQTHIEQTTEPPTDKH